MNCVDTLKKTGGGGLLSRLKAVVLLLHYRCHQSNTNGKDLRSEVGASPLPRVVHRQRGADNHYEWIETCLWALRHIHMIGNVAKQPL